MYTLGRMSFEMFRPSNLVVWIEAVFNPVENAIVDENESAFTVPPRVCKRKFNCMVTEYLKVRYL